MKNLCLLLSLLLFFSCKDKDLEVVEPAGTWIRDANNPVLRDLIPEQNYQVASDGHIFYHDNGNLQMVYAGDHEGKIAIKLAKGTAINEWSVQQTLIFETNNDGFDVFKETPFYRKAENGKHQIFYIGYDNEDNYQSQLYLAESDQLEGPYSQYHNPVVPRGELAGESVYLITSPSIVSHEGILHMVFIGWDNSPNEVTRIWVIGATSTDDGYTWSDFQVVDTPIGAEGQLTKAPDGSYVAVRTSDFQDDEALFYATSDHPFDNWTLQEEPILTKNGSILEDEMIAAQITYDRVTNEEYLFYTGANIQTGWWMMLARKE
ncbi:MAG: hypothetical protein AAF789_00455 [Bacteroidota bacterium]